MKKIIFSVLAIVLAIGATSGAAFALFSSTATVSGVTFSTGNANLQVYNGETWVSNLAAGNLVFENMYPSYHTYQQFNLKNNSSSNIKLTLNAKLANGATETPAGSWNVLKDKVWVRFLDSNGNLLQDWVTLNYLNSNGTNFDTSLAQGESRWYRFDVMVDPAAGNEISGNGLSAMTINFLGTQE